MAITILVYLPLCGSDFVNWDDTHNLVANPRMNPPSPAGVAWYWAHCFKDLYVPLTYTLWSAIAAIAHTSVPDAAGIQLNSYIFHCFNLLFHLGSAGMVLMILHRLGFAPSAAWCGAAVFALHPLQVEAVGWISGLKDVLAGFLSLTAVWFYLWYRANRDFPHRRPRWLMYLAGAICLLLAMLAKPSAVVVPPLVLILDLNLTPHRPRAALLAAGGWFILAIPFVILAKLVQSGSTLEYIPPLWFRPLVALDALAFYLRQLLAPIALGIDYGRSPQWLVGSKQLYFTWLAPVAAAIIACRVRRRLPELGIGLAILAVGLLPMLGLVSFDYQYCSTPAASFSQE